MGTLGGFPSPPALWLQRAKPAFAYAFMGTLGGFASPFGPPPATSSPLALLGLANPSRALAPGRQAVGKARLRLRDLRLDVERWPGRSRGFSRWGRGLRAPDLVERQGQVHMHTISFKSRKPHALDNVPNAALGIWGRPVDADKAGSSRWICLERHRHHGVLSGGRETGRQRPHGALDRGVQHFTAEAVGIPVEGA